MTKTYLDKVYETDPEDLTGLYDAWAGGYDSELADNGYATPARVAAALAGRAPDRTAPLLDWGCGTGMGGAALAREGFTTLDGCDLSEGMLAEARAKGVYRTLWQLGDDAPLPFVLADYPLVTAIGVISTGAAPPALLTEIAEGLAPGALLALSFNDHTLDDPAYTGTLARTFSDGLLAKRHEDYGDHLPGQGLKSMVYVLEKL